MRRIATIVLVILSLAGIMVVTATPAAAAGGACGGLSWATDDPGLSYSNGDYKQTRGADFYNANTGQNMFLKFDIQSWRLTGAGGGFIAGHCYRRTRVSVWTSDGSVGTLWMHVRLWADHNGQCTQLVSDDWTPGQTQNSSGWYTSWYDYSGCGGPNSDGYGFGSAFAWVGQAPNYPASVPYAYAGLP